MTDTLLIAALVLLALIAILQILVLRRKAALDLSPIDKSYYRMLPEVPSSGITT